uniref:(northern house mosquito) hypothetical protein n=1 Tax=Culex pipiens TaxID=7175 RepID=A0A8D8K6K5_CULPI
MDSRFHPCRQEPLQLAASQRRRSQSCTFAQRSSLPSSSHRNLHRSSKTDTDLQVLASFPLRSTSDLPSCTWPACPCPRHKLPRWNSTDLLRTAGCNPLSTVGKIRRNPRGRR